MKPGSTLKKNVVIATLKKNGNYGVTGFKEMQPVIEKPKPSVFTIGISGMT